MRPPLTTLETVVETKAIGSSGNVAAPPGQNGGISPTDSDAAGASNVNKVSTTVNVHNPSMSPTAASTKVDHAASVRLDFKSRHASGPSGDPERFRSRQMSGAGGEEKFRARHPSGPSGDDAQRKRRRYISSA